MDVIDELIQMAKDLNAAANRGEELGLTEDEAAFYDALESNDSAVKVLGDETLTKIARELVDCVRKNVSIDWSVRESAQARLRVLVKKILPVSSIVTALPGAVILVLIGLFPIPALPGAEIRPTILVTTKQTAPAAYVLPKFLVMNANKYNLVI